MRKRQGLSVADLARATGVAAEHIDQAEKADDLEWVAHDAVMRDIMSGEDTAVDAAAIIDRYVDALGPSQKEEAALRFDWRSASTRLPSASQLNQNRGVWILSSAHGATLAE